MYAGCVAGAIQKDEDLGFERITLQKEKLIIIPDDILGRYLSGEEIEGFINGNTGIYSITIFVQKPAGESDPENSKQKIRMIKEGPACTPGSGCC